MEETWNRMVDACLENGMRGRAQAIEEQMEARGIPRSVKE
jgi:hypothetical protein